MDAAVRTANLLHVKFQESLGISPRILANAGVLFSQKSDLEALVLSTGEAVVRETYEGQKPGGGDFSAEAGFRAEGGIFFREPFQVNVRRGGLVVDVKLPQVKVLRIEAMAPIVLVPQDLVWNELSQRLQTKISRSLERLAKNRLLEDGLLKRSDGELREKVRRIASEAGCSVVFSGETGAAF